MDERIGPRAWRECYAHPGEWQQSFAPLAMTDMFAASVAEHGDRALVDFLGRQFSYRDIAAEARRFASGLQSLGLVKGDRVGLHLPNVPAYLPAFFGALIAGATAVDFSPFLTPAGLEAQLADSGTRLLVTLDVPALLPTAGRLLRESALEWLVVVRLSGQLPFWKGLGRRLLGRGDMAPLPGSSRVFEWSELQLDREPDAVAIDPLVDIAMLQYTGGTVGTPRGVMLSHQNLTANARQVEAIDPHAHRRDVALGVLPPGDAFANTCVLNRTVYDGGMIAMLPRFQAGKALATIERTRVTAMAGVPAMYEAMLADPAMATTDLSSLFTCICGGSPLDPLLKARFEKASGAKLVEAYGLAETAGAAVSNPFDGREGPGSVGHPLPGTDMLLLDLDEPGSPAAPGEPGELAIAGPQVMPGYWNRPETTAFADLEGHRWLRTGDAAAIDEDGYVHILGRIGDTIAVAGARVYPSQVEAVLLAHPAVREAAVVAAGGVGGRGETPRAFVVADPLAGASARDIAEWLNARVGQRERVDRVELRPSLPRTAAGKLDRKALRFEAAGG